MTVSKNILPVNLVSDVRLTWSLNARLSAKRGFALTRHMRGLIRMFNGVQRVSRGG